MKSSLTFKFIANACGIFEGIEGTKILCDPWINDGVFEGSWCHFHPLKTRFEDLQGVHAIYISHLHPDHFDERFFNFDQSLPIIVLDHGSNFLINKLLKLGYKNLIRVRDGQTVKFRELNLTLFAPFAKNCFHEAEVGNLIDSAIVVEYKGVSAFNANDNRPTLEACQMLREKFGTLTLAMLNYNSAGPYPSCFDNLSDAEKSSENDRVLDRNFKYIVNLLLALKPTAILPFAGAYVLGGDLYKKNRYLGTTTWDRCAQYIRSANLRDIQLILLQENDILDLDTLESNRPYIPIDETAIEAYIEFTLSKIKYPYQSDPLPDQNKLLADIEMAANKMLARMDRIGIKSTFNVFLKMFNLFYQIYPKFIGPVGLSSYQGKRLECSLDERLLRRILDRVSHWNNAEIGAHISFYRAPNIYEPDLHLGLQFFHL